MMTMRDKLVHAVTEWDRKQSTKRHYNPYGLGIMLERVDEVAYAIESGRDARIEIIAGFNDRLLDHVLRSVGFPIASVAEHQNSHPVYTPTK